VTLATACSLRRVLSNESIDFIENKAAISESKNKMIVMMMMMMMICADSLI